MLVSAGEGEGPFYRMSIGGHGEPFHRVLAGLVDVGFGGQRGSIDAEVPAADDGPVGAVALMMRCSG